MVLHNCYPKNHEIDTLLDLPKGYNYDSPIKEEGPEKAQEFAEAKDCICGGDRSTRLDYHCLDSYDHSLPRTLSH